MGKRTVAARHAVILLISFVNFGASVVRADIRVVPKQIQCPMGTSPSATMTAEPACTISEIHAMISMTSGVISSAVFDPARGIISHHCECIADILGCEGEGTVSVDCPEGTISPDISNICGMSQMFRDTVFTKRTLSHRILVYSDQFELPWNACSRGCETDPVIHKLADEQYCQVPTPISYAQPRVNCCVVSNPNPVVSNPVKFP